MIGLIVKHLGKEYRDGSNDSFVSIVANLILSRDEFILEGTGFLQSFQKIEMVLNLNLKLRNSLLCKPLHNNAFVMSYFNLPVPGFFQVIKIVL